MTPKVNRVLCCVLSLLAVCSLPSMAQSHRVFPICFDEPVLPPIRIPVGCEVIDCCPGCPGEFIDWRILVTGDPGTAITLSIENLDQKQIDQLKVTGGGKIRKKGSFLIKSGETIISGFPRTGGKLPIVVSNIDLDKQAIEQLLQKSKEDSDLDFPDKNLRDIEISVQQRIGDFIVNEFRYLYKFRRCIWPPVRPLNDRIILKNNATTDNAVVLLDGRRSSGCVNDEVRRGSETINLGNVLSNGSCNSEVAVFSDDNAVELVTPVNAWTDALGNTLTVNLRPLLRVPVTIWLVQAGALARAQADVALANQLYNSNHVGIALDAIFTDVSTNANATNLLAAMRCEDNAAIRASAFFTAGRLNVYYSDRVLSGGGGDIRGRSCFLSNNQDMIGVASIAVPETLAHEVGHSCTLRHDNDDGVIYASAQNLMISGGINRDNVTEGQAFRVNVNISEDGHINILHQLGILVGLRNCEENAISAQCVEVVNDVVPN